jgi:hypothetical protein
VALRTTTRPAFDPPSPDPVTFGIELSDGLRTTVQLAAFDLAHVEMRVISLARAQPLGAWCQSVGMADALVGGFFVRATGAPLGDLRIGGVTHRSDPFDQPWGAIRACVHVDGKRVRLARRNDLPAEPAGDLLQAGPLLVHDGRPIVLDGVDCEGFSAGRSQFDSDITLGRHPRAALGIRGPLALAVTCDGRSQDDAGLTLGELAELMALLGARAALNLDGGGSATLVCNGRIANNPREIDGEAIPDGRPVSTAIAFMPRGR